MTDDDKLEFKPITIRLGEGDLNISFDVPPELAKPRMIVGGARDDGDWYGATESSSDDEGPAS